jgi:energy-coupling factor transporter ATP-binding protein EcfA2
LWRETRPWSGCAASDDCADASSLCAVTAAHLDAPETDRPFLIGVAGGSNSGKTTIVTRLAELMGKDRLGFIKLDSYYIERKDEPVEVRSIGTCSTTTSPHSRRVRRSTFRCTTSRSTTGRIGA